MIIYFRLSSVFYDIVPKKIKLPEGFEHPVRLDTLLFHNPLKFEWDFPFLPRIGEAVDSALLESITGAEEYEKKWEAFKQKDDGYGILWLSFSVEHISWELDEQKNLAPFITLIGE